MSVSGVIGGVHVTLRKPVPRVSPGGVNIPSGATGGRKGVGQAIATVRRRMGKEDVDGHDWLGWDHGREGDGERRGVEALRKAKKWVMDGGAMQGERKRVEASGNGAGGR